MFHFKTWTKQSSPFVFLRPPPLNYHKPCITPTSKMGVTPLMWKALDRNTASWTCLCVPPLSWNIKKRNLVYTPFSAKLIPWAIIYYFLVLPGILVMLAFAIAPIAGLNKLPLSDYIVNLVWLSTFSSCLFGETLSLTLGRDMAQGANCLISLYNGFQKSKHISDASGVTPP